MTAAFKNICGFFVDAAPWLLTFLSALALSLVLVPIVREVNRRLGLVDAPSARRINKTPVPRGGGLGVFLAFMAVMVAFPFVTTRPLLPGLTDAMMYRLYLPPTILVVVGYVDDKFGLPPLVKLGGQIVAAVFAALWCGLGFSNIFPFIPFWLDVCLTVFWLVGAINAFNLIDGLDGLAAGLSAIAVVGMAGALFCIGQSQLTFIHFALLGALVGFLRYNFHPATVFLGDCGSMFLGFLVASLPLVTRASNSFLVGVGIPLLAMGVPIFDTSLAILRRSVRAVLSREEKGRDEGNGHVMTADVDHLHHRILRKFASQRKAAFALYGFAALLVLLGVGGLLLKGRAAALFIVGFMAVAYIVFRDMRRIELWDAGRLMNAAAHDTTTTMRRRRHSLTVPLLLVADIAVLILCWLFVTSVLGFPADQHAIQRWLIIRAVPIFLALVFLRAYVTVWSRGLLSNYVRLFAAVVVGTAAMWVIVILAGLPHARLLIFSVMYGACVFLGLLLVRMLRPAVRDLFYALDAGRLAETPEAERIVVYGAGLRYRTFRRELVRASSHSNRVIVGLIDDDILIRDQYIGGLKVYGTLHDAPSILRMLRADAVVVACELTPERRIVARKTFEACGVPATLFTFDETTL